MLISVAYNHDDFSVIFMDFLMYEVIFGDRFMYSWVVICVLGI